MEREVDDKTILDKFAEKFCSIVEKYCRYIICSGFLAIAHGRTRGTEDIDMIIEPISAQTFIRLHNELTSSGFECIQSDTPEIVYNDYLKQKNSVRYVYSNNNFAPPEMEIKLAKDELDLQQIANRTKLPLTNLDIWFSDIESNIAFKEELLKSQKDLEDARHLRIIYSETLNEDKINKIKRLIKKYRMQ